MPTVAPVEEIAVTTKPSLAEPLSHLPAETNVAGYVDISTILTDRPFRRLLNALLINRPETTDQLHEIVTNPDVPTNLTAVSDVVGYLDYTQSALEGGVVINSEAPAEEVATLLSDFGQQQDPYRGMDRYSIRADTLPDDVRNRLPVKASDSPPSRNTPTTADSLWIAFLDAGRYAVGTHRSVKRLVDVARGEQSAAQDPLATTFDQATGPVQVAGVVIPEQFPAQEELSRVDTVLSKVDTFAGSVRRREDDLVVAARLQMQRDEHADALADYLRTVFQQAGNVSYSLDWNGTNLMVRVTETVDSMVEFIRSSAMSPVSAAGSAGVTAAFDISGSPPTLEAVHEIGDPVTLSNLQFSGSGFAAAVEADVTSAGQWAGDVSGTKSGEPAVVTGDRCTIGVQNEYRIVLSWTGTDPPRTLAIADSRS